MVEVLAGSTDLHAALVFAVVTVVHDAADLEVVAALLRAHEDPVVGRQGRLLDCRVVVHVVRVREPEVGGILAGRRESALQHHRRALVRVHLRLLGAACSRHTWNKSIEAFVRNYIPLEYVL